MKTAEPLLIPHPLALRHVPGVFTAGAQMVVCLCPQADASVFAAVQQLAQEWPPHGNVRIIRDPAPFKPRPNHAGVALVPGGTPESYQLSVSPRGIQLSAPDQVGLFYGVQTLRQLARQFGRQWPGLAIHDRPAFPQRGYYLDISRGKVPTLATLKHLIQRLAALKVNQFQLYVEHVFDFQFDPAIARHCCPLRAEEILELDYYCHAHHIAFIPSLACFGHMGRILSLPPYRRLAEVDFPAASWEQATWRQRLHGATINARDPRSRRLFEQMLAEYLPLFSSGHFNLCGDETYELGKGRSGVRTERGRAALYLQHLRFLHRLAARHGKQIMCWGDMLLRFPEAIRKVPRDCTILDWGYYPQTRFEKVGAFTHAGLAAYVCPSVRGYGAVFNAVEEARQAISQYARTGQRLGAGGLLNTDWGDYGHFNMLPAAFHGLALGAAMAWNPQGDSAQSFDRAFSLLCFGDRTGTAARTYSRAGATHFAAWPLLPLQAPLAAAPALQAEAEQLCAEAPAWTAWFAARMPTSFLGAQENRQLALACRALRWNAQYYLYSTTPRKSKTALRPLRHDLEDIEAEYARLWPLFNQPCGLEDLRRRGFQAAQDQLISAPPGRHP